MTRRSIFDRRDSFQPLTGRSLAAADAATYCTTMRNGCWVSMVGAVVAVAAAAVRVSGCGSSKMPLATQGNGGAGASGSGGVGGSAAGRGGSGGSAGTGGSATAGTGGSATAGTGGSATAGTGGTTAGTNGGGGVGGTTGGGGGRGGGSGGDNGSGGNGGGSAGSAGNHALRFDGASDQVAFPTGGADEHAYTVELWFRSAAMTGMLVEVFSTTDGGADRSLYLKNGAVCFYVFTPAYSELCTTSTTLNDGAWHHAAGVLGTNGQHLYVDGAPEASAAGVTSSAFTTDTELRAGYGYIGPNGPLIHLAGDLDEIRLWNAERTAGEIAAARATEINPATTGLQGYWKLDDGGTSTTARDATAHGYDGTLMGFTFTPSPWVTPGAF